MNSKKIVVTRKIPQEVLELLKSRAEVYVWDSDEESIPQDVLLAEVRDAAAIFTNVADSINKTVLDAAPALQVVATMAVGYDNIDVKEATRRGIPVGHTPGVLTETTADLTFSLLMATARRIPEADRFVREDKWKSWSPMLLTGQDIYGATIGIIGMGRIGEAVAKRATGFDMKILYHNRSRRPEAEAALGAKCRELDDLLREADYVVLMAPASQETRKLMGEREFSLMKPNAIFINSSRGTNVDEEALYLVLKEKRIWAAGLDVFEQEPIRADHPLLSLDNVVVAPHIGSASIATRTKMAMMTAENILRGLAGEKLLHTVNGEVYEK
ncbi:D-glycerate dehydrogenase [Brevibacillus ruminantium]|uniref:D-glycerate dehydrogenase n=1 Tax=Brevibacillus ruminantium TaxID=2950604 RepID=A0ABY4WMS8_9BACL|nr:D-glycerate dehydrogenase [Brevibacillus ruminantium]USG67433.1 D-glycerate dehydrogenase [Brevibacillus ruminantium]